MTDSPRAQRARQALNEARQKIAKHHETRGVFSVVNNVHDPNHEHRYDHLAAAEDHVQGRCNTCDGKGSVFNEKTRAVEDCPTCHGSGDLRPGTVGVSSPSDTTGAEEPQPGGPSTLRKLQGEQMPGMIADRDLDIRDLERQWLASKDRDDLHRWRLALNRSGKTPPGERFIEDIAREAKGLPHYSTSRGDYRSEPAASTTRDWQSLARDAAELAQGAATRLRDVANAIEHDAQDRPRAAKVFDAVRWCVYLSDDIRATRDPHGGHSRNDRWKSPLTMTEGRWARVRATFGTPQQVVSRLLSESVAIEFTDRYQALGIEPPAPGTCCSGQCEGTGWVPIYMPEGDADVGKPGMITMEGETDPVFVALWRAAEVQNPTDDGYHFVKCPTCEGTGTRLAESVEVLVSDRAKVGELRKLIELAKTNGGKATDLADKGAVLEFPTLEKAERFKEAARRVSLAWLVDILDDGEEPYEFEALGWVSEGKREPTERERLMASLDKALKAPAAATPPANQLNECGAHESKHRIPDGDAFYDELRRISKEAPFYHEKFECVKCRAPFEKNETVHSPHLGGGSAYFMGETMTGYQPEKMGAICTKCYGTRYEKADLKFKPRELPVEVNEDSEREARLLRAGYMVAKKPFKCGECVYGKPDGSRLLCIHQEVRSPVDAAQGCCNHFDPGPGQIIFGKPM